MMIRFIKLALSASLVAVGVLLFAACSGQVSTPGIAAEELNSVTTEPSLEKQNPTTKREVPRISAEELKERLDRGETIVIGDTRTAAAFESNHITGAISTPSSDVVSKLAGIPLDQAIVLYCS